MNKLFEIFISAAAIQGIFLALILYKNKRGNHRANIFLSVLLILFSVIILHSSYIAVNFEKSYGSIVKMNEPFILLIGPFIYFYVRELTSEKRSFNKKDLQHFIPFIIYYTVMMVVIYIEGIYKINKIAPIGVILWIITILQLTFYMIKIAVLSGIHKKKIEDEFSTIGELGIEWIKKLMTIFVLLLIVFTAGFFIKIVHGHNDTFRIVISLTSALIIFVMGYRGLRQPDVFTIMVLKNKKTEKYEESLQQEESKKILTNKEFVEKYGNLSLNETEIENIEKKLTDYMKNEKPYLNPQFNMEMLSEGVGINRNHISSVINGKIGYNFFNYVNYYRVEEVKERMINPENAKYTILAVAFDSGFNSKASFNSIFKKITGITPSEYKKNKT